VKSTNYDAPRLQNSTFLSYFLLLKYFPLYFVLKNTGTFSFVEEKTTSNNQRHQELNFINL